MADGIAIVGMAGLFPGAPTMEVFWQNIVNGVDSITEVPLQRWDPVFFDPDANSADRFYCRRGGFVDDIATFDPLRFGIMPNALDSIEPDQLLALAAASAALGDARDPHQNVDPARISVVLGRGGYIGDGVARLDQRVRTAAQLVEALRTLIPGIGEDRLDAVRAEFQQRLGPERPESSIGLVPNLAASRIANRFDLRGPAYTVDAACASSLIAVDHGVKALRSGAVDVALVGGVHHCHDLTLWSVFCQLRALSPSGQIRPFSADADGILIGEGTAIFVLKRLEDAERDQDRVYAVIEGTGIASDGAGASLMNPRSEGQVLAVEQAWRDANLDPGTVGLIEAHGTATAVGDRTEVETLRTVFGDEGAPVALGSVKSMIGHAMPAAGAAGLAKAALALYHAVLPPTLHVDEANEALTGTRFELQREASAWAVETGARRLAGVNAFGFGGINAHVVLGEHRGDSRCEDGRFSTTSTPRVSSTSSPSSAIDPPEDIVLLAGRDSEDLLAQLDAIAATSVPTSTSAPTSAPISTYAGASGPARLAIVAPNERRLTLARKILERGTAFRGRNDVWFDPGESGEQGSGVVGAKVAFLFPGVEPTFDPQVDDVAEAFGLPWAGLAEDVPDLERQGRGLVQVGLLLNDALDAINVHPDAIGGHSLGEWAGQIAAGQIPRSYLDEFLDELDPGSIEVSDVVFVALGAGADVAAELVEGLSDAYVSHDNCPHQSVICASPQSMAIAVERAKARKVIAQEMPFRSGFHSPLFEPFVAGIADHFEHMPLKGGDVEMWSATSVSTYPDIAEQIVALAGRHLVEPVRFREMITAMYADGVRTFVQVGTGSLLGFVDDTLRDHDVLTVSANAAKLTGIQSLRRVAAALWSVGVDVNWSPLGYDFGVGSSDGAPSPEQEASVAARPGQPEQADPPVQGHRLRLGSSLIRDLTPLEPTVVGRLGAVPEADLADIEAELGGGSALLDEHRALVQEAQGSALEVLRAARDAARDAAKNGPRPTALSPPPTTGVPEEVSLIETVHHLSVAEQPYWLDHAFYEQAPGWSEVEDLFPLVPMTAIIAMLQQSAEELVPGTVATRVEAIRAFKWLAVHPPTTVTVRATRDRSNADDTTGEVTVKTSIDKHARATVIVAPTYPPSPESKATKVNGEIYCPAQPDTLYEQRHLFHGPAYQGLLSFETFGEDGASGTLETKPYPGSLLDNAGQLFGYWLAQRVDKDRLVLPTSIDRISFYGPHPVEGTIVHCTVNATSITDQSVRADLELSVDGVIWCRIEGWEDRRFQSDDRLFTLLRKPADRTLAEPQSGGWLLVREGWPDSASRDVVMRRFLGRHERLDYESRNPKAQREWLVGRIAAKDAVRAHLFANGTPRVFPAEVQVRNEPNGRPVVQAPGGKDLRVSIAHRLGFGVAIVGEGVDVGIDIEQVEPRSETFERSAFTTAEMGLLDALVGVGPSPQRDQEVTRWWAAKEAAAKAAGTGMEAKPKDWEVAQYEGDRVLVGDRWISTTIIDGNMIVAWTEETALNG